MTLESSKLVQRAARVRQFAAKAAASRLGANIASLYAAQGLNYLVPLLVLPYLLRVLGPVAFGAIAFAQSFATYIQILTDFGFNFSATRAVSLYRDQPGELARIFWATLTAKAGLLLASVLLLLPAARYVPILHQHRTVIALSCLAVLGSVLLPQWYWQGLERMRAMVIIQVGSKLCMLAAVFLFVRAPSDEAKAAAILALPPLLAGGACLAAVPFMNPVRFYRPTVRDVWDALTSSWHLFVSGAATSLYVNSNVFLIGLICGDYQVALYSLANKIALAVFGTLTPIAQAAFPRASLLFGRSVTEGKAFVRRLSRYILALAGGLSVGLVLSATVLVKALGGPKFADAVPVLRIMGLLPLVLAAATILAQMVMINLGLARQLSRIYLAAGILSLALLPPLATRFGAAGGAGSLLVVESAGPLLMALAIRRSGLLRAEQQPETG